MLAESRSTLRCSGSRYSGRTVCCKAIHDKDGYEKHETNAENNDGNHGVQLLCISIQLIVVFDDQQDVDLGLYKHNPL